MMEMMTTEKAEMVVEEEVVDLENVDLLVDVVVASLDAFLDGVCGVRKWGSCVEVRHWS